MIRLRSLDTALGTTWRCRGAYGEMSGYPTRRAAVLAYLDLRRRMRRAAREVRS